MLDREGRLTIGLELLARCQEISISTDVNMFYDNKNKCLVITPKHRKIIGGMCFVASLKIDEKGRIVMPSPVRKAFPDDYYLPTEKDDEIYIFII